jgi:hypothetical protein
MIRLNKRQFEILEFIRRNPNVNSSAIFEYILKSFEDTSKITIIRDINLLLAEHYISKYGKGRNVVYSELCQSKLLGFIDIDNYFSKGPDERNILYRNFNFGVFDDLNNVFDKEEI